MSLNLEKTLFGLDRVSKKCDHSIFLSLAGAVLSGLFDICQLTTILPHVLCLLLIYRMIDFIIVMGIFILPLSGNFQKCVLWDKTCWLDRFTGRGTRRMGPVWRGRYYPPHHHHHHVCRFLSPFLSLLLRVDQWQRKHVSLLSSSDAFQQFWWVCFSFLIDRDILHEVTPESLTYHNPQ